MNLTAFLPWPWILLAQTDPTPTDPQPTTQPAATQPAATQPTDDAQQKELEKEFGKTTAADQKEAAAQQQQPAMTANAPRLPTAALTNPEISFIGTFVGAWRRKDDGGPTFLSGDDPKPNGFTAQEAEISFASDVDPYFKMRAFLTIPRLEGLEVEEAYLLSTTLPHSLQLKAGVFRSQFGRNNEQHLHVQDFATRPKMTTLVGEDGLRLPGAQLSWLVPTPWYSVLYGELLTEPEANGPKDLSGTVVLEQFFDLSDTWSLMWGVNTGTLKRVDPAAPITATPAPLQREFLVGTDVYLKWQPVNVVNTYSWVAFTAEFVESRARAGDTHWDGAGYAQIVAQVARRVRLGLREDITGLPDGPLLGREYITSASIAFLPSEFSRLRLTVQHEETRDRPDDSQRNDAVMLQLEGAIGAHGAHPF